MASDDLIAQATAAETHFLVHCKAAWIENYDATEGCDWCEGDPVDGAGRLIESLRAEVARLRGERERIQALHDAHCRVTPCIVFDAAKGPADAS